MIKIFSLLLFSNLCVWLYATLSPQISPFINSLGWKISSVWLVPLFLFPLVYLLNVAFAEAFRFGNVIKVTPLFVQLLSTSCALLVFTLGQLIFFKKLPVGDFVFLLFCVAGLLVKFWIDSK